MSVVSSFRFTVVEMSQAICPAMAVKTIPEKTGDVKEKTKRLEMFPEKSNGDV